MANDSEVHDLAAHRLDGQRDAESIAERVRPGTAGDQMKSIPLLKLSVTVEASAMLTGTAAAHTLSAVSSFWIVAERNSATVAIADEAILVNVTEPSATAFESAKAVVAS